MPERETLKTRADILAKSKKETAEGPRIKTVSFLLADETYAIELRFVREVLPVGPITYLPGIPEYIPGIINVRGEIVSITDLKRLFDLKAGEPRDNRYVLILSTPEMAFGILADRILGVGEILTETLHSSIPALTGVRADYLKGLDEAGTIVLDGDKLLTDEDLVINQNNH